MLFRRWSGVGFNQLLETEEITWGGENGLPAAIAAGGSGARSATTTAAASAAQWTGPRRRIREPRCRRRGAELVSGAARDEQERSGKVGFAGDGEGEEGRNGMPG